MDNYFCVGLRAKDVPGREQLFAERAVIIDLAIEDEGNGFVFVEDRLLAARDINDGKPSVSEPDARPEEEAFTVRSTMRDGARHRSNGLAIDSGYSVERKDPCNATHQSGCPELFLVPRSRSHRLTRGPKPCADTAWDEEISQSRG